MALSESIQILFTQFDILVQSFGTEMINFYFDQIQSPTDIFLFMLCIRDLELFTFQARHFLSCRPYHDIPDHCMMVYFPFQV